MFQALLICFREGLEGFLVVAIVALALRKMALPKLLSAVRVGLATALVGSAALGLILSRIGALAPAWEGSLSLIAATLVVGCVAHMMHAGKAMHQEMMRKLEVAVARHGTGAWWAIFTFIVFMVGREGVETATMIASLAANQEARPMALGGLIGFSLAGLVGWLWVRFGHRVNLGRFFRVTAWFMLVLAVQLVVYALHEFSEGGLLPWVDNAQWHIETEELAEGWIAQLISLGLVLVPTLWLLFAHLADLRRRSPLFSERSGR